MKHRKKLPKERNVFVAAVLFRHSGAHTKTNKAKRRAEKQRFLRDVRSDIDRKDTFADVALRSMAGNRGVAERGHGITNIFPTHDFRRISGSLDC